MQPINAQSEPSAAVAQPRRPASRLKEISRPALAACALAAALLPGPTLAADWPGKQPIRIVVGFAPGGPMDSVVRIVAPGLSRELGQSVIVENRPGAGASIGASLVARAAPDGYTLLGGHSAAVSATAQIRKVDYDPRTDLAPVAGVSSNFTVLVARTGLAAGNLAEFKALAEREPGKVTCATAGMGSGSHIACELLAETMGVKILPIHYKGSAPAATDVIGGQVDIFFDPSSLPHVQSGRMKVLATRGVDGARLAALPDIPTFGEQGYPGVSDQIWFGLLAPAGTPEAIIRRISEAVEKTVKEPGAVEALGKITQYPSHVPPQALGRIIEKEWVHYGQVIDKHGLRNSQ